MIQLFCGENDFARSMAIRLVRDEFVKQHGGQAIELREGTQLSVQDLPQLFQGASLFSPERLVIITDASDNKSVWEVLPEQLPDDPSVTILLNESHPDKRTRTYKWLQKQAEVKSFELLDERRLVEWVQTEGRAAGINFEADVAAFLIRHIGENQWRLYQEIQKLSLANQPMSTALIKEIVDPNPQATAFELLDAAVSGNKGRVEELVAIVKRGEDPYKFVGLLTSQVYALAVCSAAGNRPSATVAKDAGIHPYVASKTMTTAKRLSSEKLSSIIATIADLDTHLKTTGADPWTTIQVSLIKIAAR